MSLQKFSSSDLDRIIRMAWEDRTSYEAISYQFGLTPNEIVKVVRSQLSPCAFKRWRKRISQRGKIKNESKRPFKESRFKCARQSTDGITKGWK